MAVKHDPPFVFVSHASGDRDAARRIVGYLKAQGVQTWIAPDDVIPGKEFAIQLEEAIDRCAAFVVILSENANHSAFVRAETELAFGRHEIFPVRLSDVQPASGLALFLRLKHWSDAFGSESEANLARLAETIRIVTGMPEPVAQAAPPPSPPPANPADDGGQGLLDGNLRKPDGPPLSEDEAIRIFIGDKAPHFLDAWQRMDERKSPVSFNVAACLLAPFWALYRKMYLPGAILGGLYAFSWLFLAMALARDMPTLFAIVIMPSVGLAIVAGIFGNNFYRDHVRSRISSLNAKGAEPQAVRDRLVLYGRTAIGPPLGLAAILLFCFIAGAQNPPAPANTVCIENGTPYEVSYLVNPGAEGSHATTLKPGDPKETLSLPAPGSFAIHFDADPGDGNSPRDKNVYVDKVSGNETCGLTYRFEDKNGTVELN